MATISEDTLTFWAKSPSQTETELCENAERAVRRAIDQSPTLRERNIKIIPQGSFRNRTNIRGESDVDIGVVCLDPFFADYPEGTSDANFGNSPAKYDYSTYKAELQQALSDYFGADSVHRGNKTFNVGENTYRVDADVTAFFEYRLYYRDGTHTSGVELHPDDSPNIRIQNWPEQHYTNGLAKNTDTKRRYRALVRILKNLACAMREKNVPQATPIIGFLSECLIWNVPNNLLGHASFIDDLREALRHLYQSTKDDVTCKEWGEVNELKYLFGPWQRWSREEAHNFIVAAWTFAELG